VQLAARLLLALCLVPAAALAHAGDAERPAASPAIATAEDLLRALETAGDDIRTLSADIRYDRRFMLQGDRHIRDGRLYFRAPSAEDGAQAATGRAFAVHFLTLRIDDRLQEDPQTWVFDGRWLVEVRPAQRTFIKREIAREGDDFDPLRIGEGPMPLPIGQRADDILARYNAELLPPGDGLDALPPFLADAHQLRLTARPDTDTGDELREVRLWYMRDTLLPRMARTINRARDESYIVLLNISVNETLPEDAIDTREPPASEGWNVRTERIDDDPEGAEHR